MEAVLDLWLVRHGETEWNATKPRSGSQRCAAE